VSQADSEEMLQSLPMSYESDVHRNEVESWISELPDLCDDPAELLDLLDGGDKIIL
jgi:hypothetical protein